MALLVAMETPLQFPAESALKIIDVAKIFPNLGYGSHRTVLQPVQRTVTPLLLRVNMEATSESKSVCFFPKGHAEHYRAKNYYGRNWREIDLKLGCVLTWRTTG